MAQDFELKILLDQVSKRLDSHGAELQTINANFDRKMDAVLGKIEEIKDSKHKEYNEVSVRLTQIESERGLLGKAATIAAGAIAGVFGGWLGKH